VFDGLHKSGGDLGVQVQSVLFKKYYIFVAQHSYPLVKFVVFCWLIPLLQFLAWVFDFTKPEPSKPMAVIVSSRSYKVSSSFCCLIPKLEDYSINVICHSVNYADIGLYSKVLYIYKFFRACRHADFVFLDDTFLPVSYALKWRWIFKPQVVQLWHSAGLFKRVGLHVCKSRLLGFLMKMNYAKFDLVAVSSEACRDDIAGFMGLAKNKVIALGTSYTDRYIGETKRLAPDRRHSSKDNIVYAPTFRGEPYKVKPSPIPIVHDVFLGMEDRFDCYISAHPHDPVEVSRFKCPFSFADALSQINILITDYSSIAMDYILANPNGKLILFVPDFEDYHVDVGFYVPLNNITKYIAHDQKQLLSLIGATAKSHDYNLYREKYLTLCDGNATERLIEYLGISNR
jgi:hypothetical protein